MNLFIGHIEGKRALLTEDEARHFTKVLRGKPGDEILITDGNGTLGKGKVAEIQGKNVVVELEDVKEEFEKKPYSLHIAIAPTKSMDRMGFFLEKAVEIGIDEITFLKTFHSERKNINLSRCQKIIESAVKQSLKAYIPKLNDFVKLPEFLKKDFAEEKLIAHCDSDFNREAYKSILQPNQDYLILIGPEGDFSKEEIKLAEASGFKGISLGEQRFRTETAALAAVFGADWAN